MKELMELFTRFVVAIEKIAEPGCEQKCKCNEPEQKPEIKDIPRDYDGIAAQKDGREVLLNLCGKKGIEVKKGMRDATLVKLLREWDKKTVTVKKDFDKGDPVFESDVEESEDTVFVDTSAGQVTTTLSKGNLEVVLSGNVVNNELPEIEETETKKQEESKIPESNDEDGFDWGEDWDNE